MRNAAYDWESNKDVVLYVLKRQKAELFDNYAKLSDVSVLRSFKDDPNEICLLNHL